MYRVHIYIYINFDPYISILFITVAINNELTNYNTFSLKNPFWQATVALFF
jgi:hypothetical protein